MSRSNPTEGSKNPSRRWFEYAGGNDGGVVRYYDKEKAEQVVVGNKFQFILLDQLSTVKGWHDASDSGIYANEVRDTKQDTLVVRSFQGGVLAEGFYANIRDRIGNLGGHYVASCYIAFKDDDGKLAIGNIGFKGACLRAWMDFQKACGSKESNGKKVPAYYVDAVKIDGYDEGQKGKVVFRTPKFSLAPISAESNAAAIALDAELQEFLSDYLKRPRVEQTEIAKDAQAPAASVDEVDERRAAEFSDDDIPF
jgi:hypothetical protein